MTPISHHLTDALLLGHSAGILPEAFDLVVATHVSLCDDCRARLGAFDALGGAVLETAIPEADAPVSEAEIARVLARATRETDEAPEPDRGARPDAVFPAPLRQAVGGDLDSVRWRRIGGGVSQAILPMGRGATARLLRIPAGVAVPDHSHRGIELTLVLQGAFHDEVDRFGVGDLEVADAELEHAPTAEAGADCICLAATDARLRFRSWLPRVAQPFFRI